MNRLQKKCVIAIVGTHLLLLTILIVGPAFFNQQPKADNTQILTFIPSDLIDANANSGIKSVAQPQPIVQPQPPAPHPQQIQPVPKPVEQTPTPTVLSKIENFFKPAPTKPTPPKQTETQEHKIQPNLKQVTRTTAKPIPNAAVKNSITNLKNKLSKGTTVDMPGDSSVAYANYASVVKSVYDAAWTVPDSIANDDENTRVTITIAKDGTVTSSRIITPSDDPILDASVQKVLDRVQFIAAFPEGSSDKERTYTISFNPQIKRLSE